MTDKKKLRECKERNYHNWKIMNQEGSFSYGQMEMMCEDCYAVIEVEGDVRDDEGRFIEYCLEEDE